MFQTVYPQCVQTIKKIRDEKNTNDEFDKLQIKYLI